MKKKLPEGFRSAFDSRHLAHLPWRVVASPPLSGVPDSDRIVLARGTTGMREPLNAFVALVYYDPAHHPNADNHWFDMNGDHLTDQGWLVSHWCDL